MPSDNATNHSRSLVDESQGWTRFIGPLRDSHWSPNGKETTPQKHRQAPVAAEAAVSFMRSNISEQAGAGMQSFGDDDSSEGSSSNSTGSEDNRASSSGESTTRTGTDFDEQANEKEITNLIHKESKNVFMWREVVIGVLFITATLMTVGTYILLSREEFNSFSYGFTKMTEEIDGSLQESLTSFFEALKSLSDVVTAVASVNGSWPNVTIPSFVAHAGHLLAQSKGVSMVLLAPIVTDSERAGWESYAQLVAQKRNIQANPTIFMFSNGTMTNASFPPFAPIWQVALELDATTNYSQVESQINYDILSVSVIQSQAMDVQELRGGDLSCFLSNDSFANALAPVSSFLEPVFEVLEEKDHGGIVGYLQGQFNWTTEIVEMLHNTDPLYVTLTDSCNQSATWFVNGEESTLLGLDRLIPEEYASYQTTHCISTAPSVNHTHSVHQNETCSFVVGLYPSQEFREAYTSTFPVIYTSVVAIVFCLVVATFLCYDRFVQKRNEKVVRTAARSNAIVSSMFPTAFRDRLYGDSLNGPGDSAKEGLRSFLDFDEAGDTQLASGQPIADLFPDVTLMFADISGFTSWSSVREPAQVFVLLESCFHAFDAIAKRRRIFKVETVGDCYVAVAGLPEARKDHAVAVAKFASDCLKKMGDLTQKLEVTLGPETSDLTLRIGLHSGAVTAGVLRGERARFQLFGDTMNTASRMESTGVPGRIQLSQETADLLTAAGKSHWIKPREETVYAKGKGEMSTFFLHVTSQSHGSRSIDSSSNPDDEPSRMCDELTGARSAVQRLISEKTSRLIDWNVELLMRYLKMIVARRQSIRATKIGGYAKAMSCSLMPRPGTQPLDEVVEVIELPEFDAETSNMKVDADSAQISAAVFEQLRNYVTSIAALYHEGNAFHNFEHASHVAQSVSKLLARIVAPTDLDLTAAPSENRHLSLHDHTYGITSDPLTQFACCFSALIHDVDHMGVPNAQLAKEHAKIATVYNHRSAAEQNSIDVALSLLMEDCFRDLRSEICATEAEQRRFRQLVVNNVLATDIMDKDLKMLRNSRWDKAFRGDFVDKNQRDTINRKATIVIEHLMQASDVAHTMQHWHIYVKWNTRFFEECSQAYYDGRAEKDPAENWYEGEIGFFDFYIIPLARKLKDCGVFGVSSDEYLNYAISNRREWERNGRGVVEAMVEKFRQKRK